MTDSPTSQPESDFVCDCEGWMRSACDGEPFYQEHENKKYCVLHFPGKEKSADFKEALDRKLEVKNSNFKGVWFPDELNFYGVDFSTGADFSKATFSADVRFSNVTFSVEARFRYAIFNAWADFEEVTFAVEADFYRASFNWAYFPEAKFNVKADFASSTFSDEANFSQATFSGQAEFGYAAFSSKAEFSKATFSALASFSLANFGAAADFSEATFETAADFRTATFSGDAEFINSTLSGKMDFWNAIFKGDVNFAGDESTSVFNSSSSLDLQFARPEKPGHFSFHTVSLRPHWFVNVDASKFDFTNVGWPKLTKVDSDRRSIEKEIESLRDKKLDSPHRLLSIACWRLATNAEENHRYPEASDFRYMAMDANRLEHWRGFAFWRLSWWYWLASGYGERILRATAVLIGILLLSAVIYTQVGFSQSESKLSSESRAEATKREDTNVPLNFMRAVIYSAEVMAFQKPEPRPATPTAHGVVLLETILGPVQAALLLLAIRRKFMR